MNKTIGEAVELARLLAEGATGVPHKIMVAPPFTALEQVKQVIGESNILLGAQNMGPEESGAHTGEVSGVMLKDAGVHVVILGHSERRHLYGEDNGLINTKVRLALGMGLEVILCVGETLEERQGEVTERIVEDQLLEGLKGVSEADMERLSLAYEPVWAIGTGKTATPIDADKVQGFLRDLLSRTYNRSTAEGTIIQYGGSVKPENISGLMAMANIDGALVGGASLKAESFLAIVRFDKQ
jgi:triosephosphate isomerase